jgi:hypothetical protein
VSFVVAALLACGVNAGEAQRSDTVAGNGDPSQERLDKRPSGASGKVTEVVHAGTYTYVQVDTGAEKIWAAAPRFQVEEGDAVTVPAGLPMKNYRSETLKRTFDVVYFVGGIRVEGAGASPGELSRGHLKSLIGATGEATVDLEGIARPEGGKTVAELFAEKQSLSGNEVLVRGKVVKFLPGIMDRNWIHLKDGTGSAGADDLTVTTDDVVKVGDTILVRGTLTTKRDFGFRYKYEVLLEAIEIKVE